MRALVLGFAALSVMCTPRSAPVPEHGSFGPPVPDVDSAPDPSSEADWERFENVRGRHLEALGVPIIDCLQRRDTSHAVFHGCYDWHSSVHATYAALAIYRMTGDARYRRAAEEVLEPRGIAEELEAVRARALPPVEIPYGYSWFLLLARERELATSERDLRPMADEVAAQLREWLGQRSPEQLASGMLADEYANLPWAVVNLHRWAQFRADVELEAEMVDVARREVLRNDYDERCPLSSSGRRVDNFFPPCLHRAMALVRLLPEATKNDWIAGHVPTTLTLPPLAAVESAHQGGLNFSRAWGLWALWEATGNPVYRSSFLEHVEAHLAMPEYWNENYAWFSHWVPQFGVYAIHQTYAGA